jgi:transposase InsO family protein
LAERVKHADWISQAVQAGARQEEACKTIGLTARTLQRWQQAGEITEDKRPSSVRPVPLNKLSAEEESAVVEICNDKDFASLPPSQIVPMLADRGEYIASESSFYRILHKLNMVHHRGRTNERQKRSKPACLVASKANEVWSWDISYMATRVIGQHYYLYMIEDIFSRKIVGWEVHENETGELAAELLQRAALNEKCDKDSLVLHSDNGAPMKSMTMQAKMCDLGIAGSRSRPSVSNDNPYSESLFRTVKYNPRWPSEGFTDLKHARTWTLRFVNWYNNEHRHSGIKFVTPHQRHTGEDIEILAKRQALYKTKREENPGRWSGNSRNWQPAGNVLLNPDENNELI